MANRTFEAPDAGGDQCLYQWIRLVLNVCFGESGRGSV